MHFQELHVPSFQTCASEAISGLLSRTTPLLNNFCCTLTCKGWVISFISFLNMSKTCLLRYTDISKQIYILNDKKIESVKIHCLIPSVCVCVKLENGGTLKSFSLQERHFVLCISATIM